MIRTNQSGEIAFSERGTASLITLLLAVLVVAPSLARAADRVVKIDTGLIEGVPALTKGVTAYLGIPFAAPR